MISTLLEIKINSQILSQFEASQWQFAPGLMIVLIISAGLFHRSQQKRKKRNRGYQQKQRHERKKMALPILINTPVTHEFSVKTFDISLTGAFLAYEDLKHSMTFTSLIGKRTGIKVGDIVDIKIYIGRFSQLRCQAKVVRYNFSDETLFPKGIGIEFIGLNQRKKKVLSTLLYSDQFDQVI